MPGYFSLLRNFHKVTRRAGNSYLRNTACCVRRYASCDDKAPKPPKIQTFPVQQQKPKIKPCPPDEPCPKPINWKRWFQGALVLALLGLMWYLGRKRTEEDKCAKDALGQRKKPRKPKSQIRVPLHSKDLPKEVPYLLIGGGTACFAAFRAIKSNDPTAKVLVITNEYALPYMRPPLSKEMWFNDDPDHIKKLIFKQWNGTERSLFFEPPDFYVHPKELMTSENGGVAIAQGWQVSKIDIPSKIAILEDGYEIEYDKCLLAPGAIPRNLAVFERAPNKVKDHVTLYRSVRDFQALEDVVQCSSSIAIVGGGFLGSELACALAAKGKSTHMTVSQIFRETGNMGRVLPEYLSKWTTEKVKQQGVAVEVQAEVEEVELSKTGQVILYLSNGKKIITDHVVVAVGVEPNTALASNSQLEVDNELGGYLVNAELEARSNLYIAGDAACFYDIKLGRRRVEHHDHAVVSGRLAGENMTGAEKPYWHQSMFWSDLGPEVGYEAIGIVDSSLPTVGVFAKATERDTPRGIVTETNEGIRSESEAKCPPQDLGPLPTEPIDISKLTAPEDYGKGVIFYLRDDIVVGIVLWNVFNRMQIARQVICEGRSYNDLNEVAKLFAIHKEEETE